MPSAFFAVMATSSPSTAPGSETAGVVSLVMLSVFDVPVSDAGSRSGAEAVGGVVSMLRSSAGDTAEVLPAASVIVPVSFQAPSDIVGRSHEFTVAETTYEQVTVVPSALRAVSATVSPVDAPGIETAGVLSFVRLSEFDVPESEAARRSGAEMAAADGPANGASESIVTSSAGPAGEALPAGSVTVEDIDHGPSDIVGMSQLFTVDDAT